VKYEFDQDTHVSEVEPGQYRACLTDRWDIGTVPNGGYVMATVLSAASKSLPGDPLSATMHFLRPAPHGEASISVDIAKKGRTVSTLTARLESGGRECARLLATYGDLGALSGPKHVEASPPDLTGLTAIDRPAGAKGMPAIAARFDTEYVESTMAWLQGKRGPAELRGRVRFADGCPLTVPSLALFSDSMPPPAFNAIDPGWVPTLELTVHFRARPAPGWLHFRFATRFIQGGLLEEDGELWDEQGTLVALSRQLATIPRAEMPRVGMPHGGTQ